MHRRRAGTASLRARAVGMPVRRLWALCGLAAVAVAFSGGEASAQAAAPRLGRWDGHAGSTQVVFTVEQNGRHRRYVVRPVFYCGQGEFSYSERSFVEPFDAWPVGAAGAFRSRIAPFSGRFGADRGTFTTPRTIGSCPGSHVRFTARWDPAVPTARDGTWNVSLPANQPWYTHVGFTTLGMGSLIRSDWTVYGGPFCANYYAGPSVGLLVTADGRFDTTIPGTPGLSPSFQVSGRFLSGAMATGTYTVTGPDCSGQPIAWTARLASPADPPHPAGGDTRLEPPSSSTPRVIRYVALGDSYSSGHGVPPYDPETNVRARGPRQDICHRSRYAYSRQLTLARFELRRSFFACSGATTANVTSIVQYPGERVYQLGHSAALRAADLVTITIGGNDVRFDQTLSDCTRLHDSCKKQRAAILHKATALEPRLITTYAAIRAAVPATAAVIVLGYPQLFPKSGLPRRCQPDEALFTRGTQRFLRRAALLLRATIAAAARRAGVQFVDVTRTFAGHEICGPHGGWINHVEPTVRGPGENSVHPNRAGQAAYARAIAGYIHARIAAHAPLTPAGLPADPPPQR